MRIIQQSLVFLIVSLLAGTALASERSIAIDDAVVTEHDMRIEGQRVRYSATTGTQPVWDEDGKPVATLFYTYYQRTDVRDRDRKNKDIHHSIVLIFCLWGTRRFEANGFA
ncbi:hypothetical protein [Natronospira bacteriovora]|uniref:Uncharacterized protein n=1 Tax=Natronospira bacteriovora TaxID=3069753 RepID=A0ABU0W9Y1_9GAMM|nr:hypothetical protein [Natronospira sp. AB-CW4]MDQ2070835.1 hypothetical protein [Natronospira sp. AB-CW4]